MPNANYYIDETLGRETIRSHQHNTGLMIYDLTLETFMEVPERLTMYGKTESKMFAFVCTTAHIRTSEVSQALTWYAKHINEPDMEVTTTDPRPRGPVRIVR